jgi:hypothetical protein
MSFPTFKSDKEEKITCQLFQLAPTVDGMSMAGFATEGVLTVIFEALDLRAALKRGEIAALVVLLSSDRLSHFLYMLHSQGCTILVRHEMR